MLVLALGAGVALLSASRPWVRVVVQSSPGLPSTALEGTGNSVGPVSAVALVALAAAGGLLAARSVLRRLVALLATSAGAGLVAIAVLGMDASARGSDVAGGAEIADSARTADTARTAISAWPAVALLGGALVVLGGLAALRFCAGWPTMGARFDRAAPAARAVDPWTALDRGSDPTVDPVHPTVEPVDPVGAAAQRPVRHEGGEQH